eukprot:CAMPEP_0198112658 /NCGR_PEP_ID=MMETSP1442-20131203/4480_1 /TAXON_ID= /ORGANISM="Craspedostauros australis, Strain CCMP3328" /LENGTH=55 /DNA_ID=CAMNT_0043769515 /DNA_START=302 /DNA_END=470 /DNA_ORIENTATION=+
MTQARDGGVQVYLHFVRGVAVPLVAVPILMHQNSFLRSGVVPKQDPDNGPPAKLS